MCTCNDICVSVSYHVCVSLIIYVYVYVSHLHHKKAISPCRGTACSLHHSVSDGGSVQAAVEASWVGSAAGGHEERGFNVGLMCISLCHVDIVGLNSAQQLLHHNPLTWLGAAAERRG
jgi:hypothetical protein